MLYDPFSYLETPTERNLLNAGSNRFIQELPPHFGQHFFSTRFVLSSSMNPALNKPAGTLVPSAFYQKDERVKSIMIEVNRPLYMDETTGRKAASFRRIKADIRDIIEVVARS